jgi:predicted membrane channel-forming protein YqfA (hemolysin III family)
MNTMELRLYRRLRIAGGLIIAGLLVELLSLFRIHPLAFLSFMFIGGGFLIAGIVLYLFSIVDAPSASGNHAP